ncbi:MAG: hypothetical protein Q4D92_02090 [Slackia sp.]|nr:hypothetical protein [Slackia sp.]
MRARTKRPLAVFLLSAVLCAVFIGGAAWPAEGDGSSQDGAVVSVSGDEGLPFEGEAASSGEAASPGEQEEASAQDEVPSALEADGNEINDGQVSDTSFLYDAAIADLAGADSYYDGQIVQVRGEAVGEAIRMTGISEGFVWVTLADVESNSSVSVVMRKSDAERIDTYGAYGKTGSQVRVQGTFNLACSEHEGESDIHATSVTIEEKGFAHPDGFDIHAFFPGLAALVFGAFLMVMFWYVRERSR